MPKSVMSLANLICHKCGTRLPTLETGNPDYLSHATCPTCSTPFAFIVEPARATSKAPASTRRRLSFHGQGGSLFGIQIVNLFLTLVTLGVYYFWSKVRVRRYLLSQTELDQDRFAYEGTGKELLHGFLMAVVVFGIPYAVLNTVLGLLGLEGVGLVLGKVLAVGVLLLFIPVAIVGARRYRLSRTTWRTIRFSFRGRAVEFIKIFWKGLVLTLLTVGAYYPVFATRRHAYLVTHSYVGNQPFRFDGDPWALSGAFLKAFLLTPITLGLSWVWFMATKQKYFLDHTTLGAARFHSTVKGGGLLRLYAGNMLLLILTLGLAFPWAVIHQIRYTLDHLTLEGPVDVDSIRQETPADPVTGEGLSSFLDTGFDF